MADKPFGAKLAEYIRGSPAGTTNTLEPLPRPKTVGAGITRICIAGYACTP